MNVNEAKIVITTQGLGRYNFGDDKIRENEVGILYKNSEYVVYSTDEKANLRIVDRFSVETDAIDRVIECLRINKKIEDLGRRKGY